MENQKMQGVFLDTEDDAVLRIYARLHKITLSKLLRKIIHEWMRENDLGKKELIESFVKQSLHEWQSKKIQMDVQEYHISEFDFLMNELKVKTLPFDVYKKILERYESHKGSTIEHTSKAKSK